MTDWRDLPPVDEPLERRELLSQSFLARMAVCPRSAYLYGKHRGGPGSHEMHRGGAAHRVFELLTRHLVEQQERQVPWEVAKDIANEVLADPAFVLPPREADEVRMMAYHWSEGVTLDPQDVLAVEEMFVLPLGEGVSLRGKLDLALRAGDRVVDLWDYKTTFHLPPYDEYGVADEDGVLRGPRDFQLVFYAVLFAFGAPEGGLPMGEAFDTLRLWQKFPAYLWADGIASRGPVVVTRAELLDHRAYLEGLARKALAAFESQRWPAVPGPHCSECAAPGECPLPVSLRGLHGLINSREEAEAAAALHYFWKAELDALWRELREWAKLPGRAPIRFGEFELAFEPEERVELVDRRNGREKVQEAAERAARYGEPFRIEDHWRVRRGTRFVRRRAQS